MKRCASVLTAIALTALATTTAFAEGARRGGGGGGMGPGRYGPAYEGGRGYGRPGGPDYGPRYGPPPAPRGGGYYSAPREPYREPYYEPPLAPAPYRSRGNSLGAQWAEQQDQAQMGVRRGAIMPLSRVVQNLQRLRPGRVLDAGMETAPDGRAIYRVRWAAAGGRRIDFIIDAATGAVIGRGAE